MSGNSVTSLRKKLASKPEFQLLTIITVLAIVIVAVSWYLALRYGHTSWVRWTLAGIVLWEIL